MASNLFSRFLPNTSPSIYEDLRAHDEASDHSDLEERAGMAVDEENLTYQDYELNNADDLDETESRITTESTAFLPPQQQNRNQSQGAFDRGRDQRHNAKWLPNTPRMAEEDGDDDVPASLLIEDDEEPGHNASARNRNILKTTKVTDHIIPGPSTRQDLSRWGTTEAQQRLDQDNDAIPRQVPVPKHGSPFLDARDKALWTWLNASNLDHFIAQVYNYYTGAGIWCICLERALNLLTVIFVAVFTTFLTQCVEYKEIPQSKTMSEILIPQCTNKISGISNVLIWLLSLWIFWKIFMDLRDIGRLWAMHNFYLHLLNIPDSDIQTISWQDIVGRLMALRDAHPLTATKVSPNQKRWLGSQSKERLDAHDIANRLMRRENYLIALFNKDILDLTVPLPFLQGRQIFSRTIEWNLHYCVLDFIFNDQGQVRQLVLKDTHRRQLSDALRQRFLFAGFMNVICAPFIVVYLLIVYFFKYFNEYQKNPSALGSRQYTPLAEWKFREFNELPHLFNNRINMSYPFASRYVEQFPKKKLVQGARFVAFVAGAIVSVLALASVIDPELFLTFEITTNRTVLFYLGLFGAIWAGAHGSIPDANQVFDPEYALRNVIDYTHYMPDSWKDKLHSDEVKREFSELYQMKIVIFIEEVFSIILTPFVLWWSLPQCCDRIIDFFREFTIHVDGLGYVCSFAVFDFKKGVAKAAPGQDPRYRVDGLRDDYYSTKHGKMAASFYGFIDNYVMNPKTGIPGHVPPGLRQNFHPPPAFPGLMSPTLAGDMQASRLDRSVRPSSRAHAAPGIARTPRFPAAGTHTSPMPSILLDPHHQPSSTGFGGIRSLHGQRGSRSKFLPSKNIIEDDEDEIRIGTQQETTELAGQHEETSGLDESRWETSPTRTSLKRDDEEEAAAGNVAGVLGLLYEFQKAQTDGRAPGVSI